jgi:pilus assembly protein CpaF
MNLLERLEKTKNGQPQAESAESAPAKAAPALKDDYLELKERMHAELIEFMNNEPSQAGSGDEMQEDYILKTLDALIAARGLSLTRADRSRVVREIYNDVLGLGPLEPLLEDQDITEIMVNGPHLVYIERKGKIEISPVTFKDDEHVHKVIQRIVSSVGRRVTNRARWRTPG